MSQWSGPGRGTGPGGRSSDLSSSGSGRHNGKDAAMLSDLPRKVRVCLICMLYVYYMYICLCAYKCVCVCVCVSMYKKNRFHSINCHLFRSL